MGYFRHHVIVVMGWRPSDVDLARAEAVRLFAGLCEVSPVCASARNGFRSFFVPSDGSKEFWPASNAGDAARAALLRWVKDSEREGVFLQVMHAVISDEEGEQRIVQDGA